MTAGTACPAIPSQRTAAIANHENSTAAGRKVSTPSATARSQTRAGGRSPWRIAHAAAYARLNAGDAATSRTIRSPTERSAISWSDTATGTPSTSARQKFRW